MQANPLQLDGRQPVSGPQAGRLAAAKKNACGSMGDLRDGKGEKSIIAGMKRYVLTAMCGLYPPHFQTLSAGKCWQYPRTLSTQYFTRRGGVGDSRLS